MPQPRPSATPPSGSVRPPGAPGTTPWQRWRSAWDHSLRFRLLTLGLLPLVMAFPIIIGVLVLVGGGGLDTMLQSNLRGNLAGANNYLDQLKNEAGVRVGQMVRSERLIQLLSHQSDRAELNRVLATTAKGSGLDYLIVAAPDGTVLGASTNTPAQARLPSSHVMRQAGIGLVTAAYERVQGEDLAAFSVDFPAQIQSDAQASTENQPLETPPAILINAAAHFPLEVGEQDAVLVGGILLNKNVPLVEHMRAIIFPVGMLPGDAEGMTAIYSERVNIAISRQRQQGQRFIGARATEAVYQQVVQRGEPWLGTVDVGGQSHMAGYQPLVNGEGERIGMIAAGFPDGPYRTAARTILALIAGVMALTMLLLSVLFLRAGRELTRRLENVGHTMVRVRQGERDARVGAPVREDELGQLTRHFDVLLDTIAIQDARQRSAQQEIADEALRRRALFEHERDGVIILNPDGTVFEANPKAATMLGYRLEELQQLHASAFDTQLSEADVLHRIHAVDAEGQLLETQLRRKDHSTFPAEVSVSKAQWADRTFVLLLLRNITQRRAVQAELELHRIALEQLVEQRTLEVQERSEQLNTIFALSPDGFVSFDTQLQVRFANLAFLRMTGLQMQDILGLQEQAFSELLAAQCVPHARFAGVATLRKLHLQAQEAPSAAGQAAHNRRQLMELSGPGARVLEVGVRTAEGQSVSQILYLRDVTYEMEVDRMKSEFLSTAAHELRTPMASIYGYAEVLLMQGFEPEEQAAMLETIFRQSELMASIINELLDLARIEARRGKDFVRSRLPVQDIVRQAVAHFKPPAGRAAPLCELPEVPLHVTADRNKMQQAMLNVLSNAFKYSPKGGDVHLRCSTDTSQIPARARIEIRDAGMGMTPEQLSRVCERFYRADTSGQIPGTGLGMSIVKEIVELHGGEVRLHSKPGQGTTVAIFLPLA